MSENKEKTLEEMFNELNELVAKLKAEDLPLEESFKLYKEGLTLAEQCGGKIEKIECDIKLLEETGDE